MARSKITSPSDDLVSDSGAVLWSFVQGEQLEFPLSLNFVEDATAGYTYEAVVIEADNVQGSDEQPITIKIGGVQTKLNVRVPEHRGNWDAAQAYNREEVVNYNQKSYKLVWGVARTNAVPPSSDPSWEEVSLGTVYLQFPKTLSLNWGVSPSVTAPIYGFFELRVTEPDDSIFQRTWKPVRGMVQILFSPTEIVPD
jgi:hypothetical protein